ncbi:MAG: biopolymer transporter ExbD [Deltaproteobacteria bacterium]|nr:biopolymer transporter ExbD [Deltaproteobacteria bacterium]
MSYLRRVRAIQEEDTEPNMVPVMNLFMVLIPFLLMSASFFHIKAINTSVPSFSPAVANEQAKIPEIKVTVIMEIKNDCYKISALSDQLTREELLTLETTLSKPSSTNKPLAAMTEFLKRVKIQYPASDTMLLIPDATILYDEIIWAMDCVRSGDGNALFPNVVLSASIG